MNLKKIAIVHNLAPGGAKRILHEMMKYLPKYYNVNIHEFSNQDNNLFDLNVGNVSMNYYPEPKLSNKFLLRLPIIGLVIKYFELKRAYFKIAKNINNNDYDCVIVNHCKYTQSSIIMRMLKKPIIYYCHEPPRSAYEPLTYRDYYKSHKGILKFINLLNSHILKKIDNKNVSKATKIITSSYYSAEVLYRVYGLKSDVVHPGININLFSRKQIKRKNILLSVGSLNPIKNHDFIIRSIGLVDSKIRPGLRIVCPKSTNDINEEKYLVNTAKKYGVKIQILCGINDLDLVQLYSESTATLFCPNLEPFGLVSLESMACGTPVLGVNEAGLRESIKDGETGYLLPWDEKMFAKKITMLINNPLVVEKMKNNCLQYLNDKYWPWEYSVERFSKFINDV